MYTLPDLLHNELDILSVGLNPSLPSVEAGFYFANPRNRFWKALNACQYFPEHLEPSLKTCHYLLKQHRIGFTDLVKRPSAGCQDLKAVDYRTGSDRLYALVQSIQPRVIWFQGKLTCQKYLQYRPNKKQAITWGKQTWTIDNHAVFVTPNPSSANAAFSLEVIAEGYQQLFNYLPENRAC